MSAKTRWYEFKQNNSGGSFEHDAKDGIGYAVFIEAWDANHANARAERIGLYFDGCDGGRDCHCCGDRWYRASQYGAKEFPSHYGEPVIPADDENPPFISWGYPSYMHRIGGEFCAVAKPKGGKP